MITTYTPTFDDGVLAQALDVLAREEPSPRQQRLFNALNVAVWSALVLTVVWMAAAFTPYHWQAFQVAALSYGAVFAASLSNLPLLLQLRRAARAERRLGMFTNLVKWHGRQSNRYSTAINVARHVIGYPLTGLGLLGLTALQLKFDEFTLLFAVSLLTLGLACVFVYPMNQGRRRLATIAKLRRSLLEARATGSAIDPALHDRVTCVESVQIDLERTDSIRQRRNVTIAMNLTNDFNVSVETMPDEIVAKVFDTLDAILQDADRGTMHEKLCETVPGTDLEIRFRYDTLTSTIDVTAVGPRSDRLRVSEDVP